MSSRARFLTGAAAAGLATVAAPTASSSTGALSGPWCKDLTKSARELIYDFSLYTLDRDRTNARFGYGVVRAGRPTEINVPRVN
jgi:hypothetical protein